MRFIPVPGFGMPGSDVPLLDPNANLSWYLDKQFLPGAMYEKTRDPEGILSTFPAIATALLGVLTGEWLATLRDAKQKVVGMAGFGTACVVAGLLWAVWFPINKKLWTSSFVLFTAGCALLCLALCYWINDVKLHRGFWTKPFVIFGTNAIAAYTLAELLSSLLFSLRVHVGHRILSLQEYIYHQVFGQMTSPRPGIAGVLLALRGRVLPAGLVDVPQAHLPQGVIPPRRLEIPRNHNNLHGLARTPAAACSLR